MPNRVGLSSAYQGAEKRGLAARGARSSVPPSPLPARAPAGWRRAVTGADPGQGEDVRRPRGPRWGTCPTARSRRKHRRRDRQERPGTTRLPPACATATRLPTHDEPDAGEQARRRGPNRSRLATRRIHQPMSINATSAAIGPRRRDGAFEDGEDQSAEQAGLIQPEDDADVRDRGADRAAYGSTAAWPSRPPRRAPRTRGRRRARTVDTQVRCARQTIEGDGKTTPPPRTR